MFLLKNISSYRQCPIPFNYRNTCILERCLRAVYSMLIAQANLSRTNVKALRLNNGTVVRVVVRQWHPNAFRLVAPSTPKTTERTTPLHAHHTHLWTCTLTHSLVQMYTQAASRCACLISRPYVTRLSKVHAHVVGFRSHSVRINWRAQCGTVTFVRLTWLFQSAVSLIIRYVNITVGCINKYGGHRAWSGINDYATAYKSG